MRLLRLLKKLNWKIYLMELVIVILGISIAYQLNIIYEKGINNQLELAAIENLRKENEINIREFNSLADYRIEITDKSENLFLKLREKSIVKDSVEKYLFYLIKTATPDLQQEASNFYLNSNYSNSNLELKNDLLTLKTYIQELIQMSEVYSSQKAISFREYLQDAVDFSEGRIVDMKKITSLKFKNTIWSQTSDEYELNRLYKQATDKLQDVQNLVEQILKDAE